MFFEKSDIYNFADDNTSYKSSPRLSVVLNCLEQDITIVLNWFKVNALKSNLKKIQFMVLGGKKTVLGSFISSACKASFFSENSSVPP